MNKSIPSVYKKAKAAILLLCLFFMMVNTCPVRSLLVGAPLPNVEFSKESTGTQTSVNDLRCSEGKVTEAVMLDFSKTNNSSLPFPLFLSVLSLYFFLSVLNTGVTFTRKDRKLFFTDSVPLFLKNRSIII